MTDDSTPVYRDIQSIASEAGRRIPVASTIKGYLDGRGDGFKNGTPWLKSEHDGISARNLVLDPYEAGYQLGIGRELENRDNNFDGNFSEAIDTYERDLEYVNAD